MNLFKQISSAKTPYLHLIFGLLLFVPLFIFLLYLRIFIYWLQFGEGESSSPEYHPVAIVLYDIFPLLLIIFWCLFLIFKNYKADNLPNVKSYCIVTIALIAVYLTREMLFSDWINS